MRFVSSFSSCQAFWKLMSYSPHALCWLMWLLGLLVCGVPTPYLLFLSLSCSLLFVGFSSVWILLTASLPCPLTHSSVPSVSYKLVVQSKVLIWLGFNSTNNYFLNCYYLIILLYLIFTILKYFIFTQTPSQKACVSQVVCVSVTLSLVTVIASLSGLPVGVTWGRSQSILPSSLFSGVL